MLKLSEHFEYYHKDHLTVIQQVNGWEDYFTQEELVDELYYGNDKDKMCVHIRIGQKEEQSFCAIRSSYYVGLDYLPRLDLKVYIEPKLNSDEVKLNYVGLLLDSLSEAENFDHLEGLIETKFDEDWLEIESQEQVLLTPFLMAQFVSVVKYLVRKGLKKSYYTKKENLRNRVKGKVLVGEQIKQNLLKNRVTQTVCQYQEFGFDTEANQFLKHVLRRIQLHLSDWSGELGMMQQLQEQLNYCKGGFQQVSDCGFSSYKHQESNPFYKNYNVAIVLGNQILKLQDQNISSRNHTGKVLHPRFWIDMSKLFELYVFKKLRQRFPIAGEVKYHAKFNRQEPDFILNTECGLKAVVDAKYKPRYKSGNPSMADARQLAGYSRLNSVYKELNLEDSIVIPCYLVYPSELISNFEVKKDENVVIEEMQETTCKAILNDTVRKSNLYKEMYLQEVSIF